jgi:hypothetical protein
MSPLPAEVYTRLERRRLLPVRRKMASIRLPAGNKQAVRWAIVMMSRKRFGNVLEAQIVMSVFQVALGQPQLHLQPIKMPARANRQMRLLQGTHFLAFLAN